MLLQKLSLYSFSTNLGNFFSNLSGSDAKRPTQTEKKEQFTKRRKIGLTGKALIKGFKGKCT